MIHGSASFSQIQHGRKGAGDIGLCLFYCLRQFCAFGQIGCNGAGQCTACAMGIGIVDPFSIEPAYFFSVVEKIVGVIALMTSFAQHAAAVGFADPASCRFHVGRSGYLHRSEDLRFGNIGRDHRSHRQQKTAKRLRAIVRNQTGAAGRRHHRIHHDIFRSVFFQLPSDDTNQRGRRHHNRSSPHRDGYP